MRNRGFQGSGKGATLAVVTADTAAESTIYRAKPNPPESGSLGLLHAHLYAHCSLHTPATIPIYTPLLLPQNLWIATQALARLLAMTECGWWIATPQLTQRLAMTEITPLFKA